jgi:D-amino-acid dehydrogenase
VKIIVLGAGVVGVTGAWYLAAAGHEVTVIERRAAAGLETSFANGGQISAGHAEPWAKPSVVPKILRWLGREDAPLLFRPRADRAQWEWGARFLLECFPGRFQRHSRTLAGLAGHSRDCLRALRAQLGIHYDHLERGILQFATSERDLEGLTRHAEEMAALGMRREVKSAAECFALEPALRDSKDRVLGGVYDPKDESGDAHRFTVELARHATERGVVFRFDTAITAIAASGGQVSGVLLENGETARADAYVVSLGSYSPLLLRPLGIGIPVYPLKGYSITLPLGPKEAAAAPTVSLTDEAFKIVISRLGNRLRAAGRRSSRVTTRPSTGALHRDRRAHPAAVPGTERRDGGRLLDRVAPGDAEQRAGHRQDQAEKPLPQYRGTARSAGRSPAAPPACWRTWFPGASRRSRFRSHEELAVGVPPGARPALPRAALALVRRAEDGAAARLDGRLGFVPVHGRCAAAGLGCLRARLARIRTDRLGKGRTATGSRTTSPTWMRCSTRSSRSRRSTLVGHSLGGNVGALYAGARPERVARFANLEGFGMAPDAPRAGAEALRALARELRDPPGLRPYENFSALAARLQAGNQRLSE